MNEIGITVRTSRGGDPVSIVKRIRIAATPTADDARLVGEHQHKRILDRTARGVDIDGRAFAPYSENGPYYYNPNGRLNAAEREKLTAKQQKQAVGRVISKLRKGEAGPGAMGRSRTGRTVKFESYAAFKKWAGRQGVDLRGLRAPHMLQQIAVKAAEIAGGVEVRLGIYGAAAVRAQGHNEGARHLPKRHFFGVSKADAAQMAVELVRSIRTRLRGK